MLLLALLAPVASAAPQVTLRPAAGPPGSTVSLQGAGFPARGRVTVRAGTRMIVPRADSRGRFVKSFRLPAFGTPSLKLTSSSGRRNIVNWFARSSRANVFEFASAGGERLRWGPPTVRSGGTVSLAGSGLRPRAAVQIAVGSAPVATSRTSSRGSFAKAFVVPPRRPGVYPGRVTVGGVALRLPFELRVLDGTPPQTTITKGPSDTTRGGPAQFSFFSEPGATFECRRDNGAWAPCRSPATWTDPDPSEGNHTWQVRARDAAGNTDPSPATSTWTVDTTGPDAPTITDKPSSPTASKTASFGFSGAEQGGSFECKLDTGSFEACAPPTQVTDLPEGEHTFSVRQLDGVGNPGQQASYSFTVDSTAPDTNIDKGPSGSTSATSASFEFSSEAGATFECKLDDGAWVGCPSPNPLDALPEGQHTFSVRAKDALGNTDQTPAERTWTVDTTPPDSIIDEAPPGSTGSTSASFAFSATEGATFRCKLDDGEWGGCDSPKLYESLTDGEHTFQVEASDAAGNADPSPATRTWTITPPAPGNLPPSAKDDEARVGEAGTIVLDPSDNDSAPEPGQSLTVKQISQPASYGHAKLITTGPDKGRVEYRAPSGYDGPDWFDYEVCDSEGACDTATVSLAVSAVTSRAETDPPVTPGDDVANDVAVWLNKADPDRSAVIGTDKGSGAGPNTGLAVYGLDGKKISDAGGGKMNGVDVRNDFPIVNDQGEPEGTDLVAATDRTNNTLQVFKMNRASRQLEGAYSGNGQRLSVSAYGTCMYRSDTPGRWSPRPLYVFVTSRDGDVVQFELADNEGTGMVELVRVRSFRLATENVEARACVADDRTGDLYVSEENKGIWKYGAEPGAGTDRALVDSTDASKGGHLTADVRGLALSGDDKAGGDHLIASSQGASEYAVYDRGKGDAFVRRIGIAGRNGIDAVQQTDGLDAATAGLGSAFPGGLLAMHDRDNEGGTFNFKLVPLDEVLRAAGSRDPEPRPTTSCSRPYGDASPWNSQIGSSPSYDARSDFHIDAFKDAGDPTTYEKLSSDPSQYTYPVYNVDSSTPKREVTLSGNYSNVTGTDTEDQSLTNETGPLTVSLPLPDDVAPAVGTDGQIVVLDRETGDEWGFWEFERDPATGAYTATNGYHYNTRWDAVPPRSASGNAFGSRGAGVPYMTGLVRPCEIARGRIDHALAFAYDDPIAQKFVYPASKTDGRSTDPRDMPEGSRLQLDPSISRKTIEEEWNCTGPCLTMARALQEYGMYIIDHAGRPKVMLEYEDTARWRGVVDENTARSIPLHRFKLLEAQAPPP